MTKDFYERCKEMDEILDKYITGDSMRKETHEAMKEHFISEMLTMTKKVNMLTPGSLFFNEVLRDYIRECAKILEELNERIP